MYVSEAGVGDGFFPHVQVLLVLVALVDVGFDYDLFWVKEEVQPMHLYLKM